MNDVLQLCGPDGTLIGIWNHALVALSWVVAVAGSFVALDWAERMRNARDETTRRRFFVGGATLMGVAVWTMHFVGMLALNLRVPVRYDWVLSAVSVLAAAFGAGLAFLIVNREKVTRFNLVLGAVAMGLAIASMHYLGMASMRLPATIRYDPVIFILSVLIAIAASAVALNLARGTFLTPRNRQWVKTLSALVMGAGIAGMHYVGMAAASYVPSVAPQTSDGGVVGALPLGNLLIGAGVVIGVALLAMVSRYAADRQAALASLEEKTAEALAASRAKDIFLASLSHELRTPLNPALLLATDASANAAYPPAAREAFAEIARAITLEARLIDDLLDLTRISRGILKLDSQPVDVHRVLQEAIAVIDGPRAEKNIEVATRFSGASAWVMADPERLKQVCWNLLQNALKFSEPGSKITVQTVVGDGKVAFQVQDQGIGMAEEEIARCFDTFSQGRHQRGGLGMGLAISRRIIELSGGAITATSPGPGRGSTFTATLAAIAPPAKDAQADRSQPAAGILPSLRILLVEDHESSRRALNHLLQRRGHTVVAADTVATARAAADGQAFDVLVSDIGLPDGDGYELLRDLRLRQPIAGIAVTGYGMEEDLRRAQEAGFIAHLTKPITAEKMYTALAQVLPHVSVRS